MVIENWSLSQLGNFLSSYSEESPHKLTV